MHFVNENTHLHLTPYGIGWYQSSEDTVYFGFKESVSEIETTGEILLSKSKNSYLIGDICFQKGTEDKEEAATLDEMKRELYSLPISKDLQNFGLVNLAKLHIKLSKEQTQLAINNMENMIKEAELANIEVPAKAYQMLEEVKFAWKK